MSPWTSLITPLAIRVPPSPGCKTYLRNVPMVGLITMLHGDVLAVVNTLGYLTGGDASLVVVKLVLQSGHWSGSWKHSMLPWQWWKEIRCCCSVSMVTCSALWDHVKRSFRSRQYGSMAAMKGYQELLLCVYGDVQCIVYLEKIRFRFRFKLRHNIEISMIRNEKSGEL